jgi:alpha-tubulin suppressor-like RCC1 family protein
VQNRLWSRLGIALAGVLAVSVAWGYDILRKEDGSLVTYDSGPIPMQIKLGTDVALEDGTNYSSSVQAAMAAWNPEIGAVQFEGTVMAPGPAGDGDHVNEIVFSDSIYGAAFGANTLAVTMSWSTVSPRIDGTYRRTQSDIIFNNARVWTSYRGAHRNGGPYDIRRVAIHELGHVLGLAHPDEAVPPQSVTAIMNSTISSVDAIQPDDRAGAQFLYGSGVGQTTRPANDDFAAAFAVNLVNNAFTWSANNYGATKEPGEPNHATDEPGGSSVWWKWTAPGPGSMTITTAGSSFDTLLAAYTGSAVTALSQIASNDDMQTYVIRTSSITFATTTGTTYYIAVDGWDAWTGIISLNFNYTPPSAPPSILSHPSAANANAGQMVQFHVTAAGSPAPTYRWQRTFHGDEGWMDIFENNYTTGTGTDTITVGPIQYGNTGERYRCRITNALGTVTSDAGAINVNNSPPRLYHSPNGRYANLGDTVVIAPFISGSQPMTYVWQKWNTIIPGANQPTLTLSNVTAEDASTYRLTASNAFGAAHIDTGQLVIRTPPIITIQPDSSRTIPAGLDLLLGVQAYAHSTISYQWQLLPAGSDTWMNLTESAVYGNVNTSNMYVYDTTLAMNGDRFRCALINELGVVYSNVITLTVTIPLPAIETGPTNRAVLLGDTVNFTTSVSSPVPVTYQWFHNGVPLVGATGPQLTIVNFQSSDTGNYTVQVTNSAGTRTSNNALLAVAQPPVLVHQPQSLTVNVGATARFSVTVSSNAPFTYQWKKDGVDIMGANSANLNLYNVNVGHIATYTVVVSNIAGTVTSDGVTLTVQLPPVITQQPVAAQVLPTKPANFTVAVSSSIPVSYQWQRRSSSGGNWGILDGVANIIGATADTLTVGNVQPIQNGEQYRCVITNAAGSIVTNAVTLTVAVPGLIKPISGRYHSLRFDTVSRLYVTGTNTQGQLGDGTTTNVITPKQLTIPGQTVTDVAAGAEHSLFLTSSGQVWATGFNATGQLGDGTNAAKSTPALLTTNAAGIAAGRFHSAVLKADGTLWTTGGNDSGQLGNGNTTDTNVLSQVATDVVELAAGIRQSFFIKSDGTLWGMGDMNGSGTPVGTPVQIATNVKAVAAGGYHSLFLKTDGTLWALGYNPFGQLGTGDTTDRTTPVQVATAVKAIATGYFHSAFIKTDNGLWLMGYNSSGQLGDGTATSRATPFQLATNVAAVSASEAYTLFTKTDGSLWGTGYNAYGQFGNGGTVVTSSPVQIATGVILAPEAPSGLTATSSVSFDRVRLLWTPQGSAASYEVWRHSTNNSTSATLLASGVRWPVYEDRSVALGQAYYYWVKAVNSAGSTISAPASASTGTSLNQTITFAGPLDQPYTTTPITLSATASSGLPASFSLVSGPANLAGNQLTLTGVGTVTVRAAQAGDASYDAAPNVDRSFVVSKATATVTLGSLSATYDGTSKSATATTDPVGLTVGFTYDGNATAPTNAGSYAVVGTISDPLYQGSANDSLVIAPATQTITFNTLLNVPYTATPIALSATASSGLPVVFSVQSGAAILSGSNLTLTGTGSITVRAAQSGDGNYAAAANVDRTFTVTANFDSWELGHFTAPELTDANVSGPNADPDADGFSNLVEYALGLEPRTPSTTGLPEVTTDATHWIYTYTRPEGRTDITCAVEVSTDLSGWGAPTVAEVLVSASGGVETWQAKQPLSSANTFFRLKISQP